MSIKRKFSKSVSLDWSYIHITGTNRIHHLQQPAQDIPFVHQHPQWMSILVLHKSVLIFSARLVSYKIWEILWSCSFQNGILKLLNTIVEQLQPYYQRQWHTWVLRWKRTEKRWNGVTKKLQKYLSHDQYATYWRWLCEKSSSRIWKRSNWLHPLR